MLDSWCWETLFFAVQILCVDFKYAVLLSYCRWQQRLFTSVFILTSSQFHWHTAAPSLPCVLAAVAVNEGRINVIILCSYWIIFPNGMPFEGSACYWQHKHALSLIFLSPACQEQISMCCLPSWETSEPRLGQFIRYFQTMTPLFVWHWEAFVSLHTVTWSLPVPAQTSARGVAFTL